MKMTFKVKKKEKNSSPGMGIQRRETMLQHKQWRQFSFFRAAASG
jgi:hypothetical protein